MGGGRKAPPLPKKGPIGEPYRWAFLPDAVGGVASVEGEGSFLGQGLDSAVNGALVRHGAVGEGLHLLDAGLDEVKRKAAHREGRRGQELQRTRARDPSQGQGRLAPGIWRSPLPILPPPPEGQESKTPPPPPPPPHTQAGFLPTARDTGGPGRGIQTEALKA